MKRVIAIFTMLAMLIAIAGTAVPVMAEETEEPQILEWNFSEYTEEVKTTEDGFIEEYNGLSIAIANNGADSDHDKITNGGVYWRGGGDPKNGDSTRYISYTPETDGTFYVTGKLNKTGGRWGIHTALDYNFSADYSNQNTELSTISMECSAGMTYYVYAKTRSAIVTNLKYVPAGTSLPAKVYLNNMYSDNMLIQRDKPIYLEGYSENAEKAVLTLTNDSNPDDTQSIEVSGLTNESKWSAELNAVSNYTDTYTLRIEAIGLDGQSSEDETEIKNIKFGDLYLCSGQSNMWYYMTHYIGLDYSEEEVENCANSDIRVLQLPTPSENSAVVNRSQPQDKLTIDGQWRELNPDFIMNNYLPATVYSIAKKLNSETDVPIGIISSAVGGTTIAQWLENTGIDDYNKKKNWYNTRIYPFRNLNINGIFWYQGCSDKDNGLEYYEKRMTELINSYRNLFGNDKLPFYYVQLARNGIVYPDTTNNEREDNTGMRDVRSAQTDTYLNMPDKTNLGFVSTLDVYGEKNYIPGKNSNFSARVNYHTAQKSVIAGRLADIALYDIYGMNEHKDGTKVYKNGPLYKNHYNDGNKLVVEFDCSGALKVMPKEQYEDNHSAKVWQEKDIDPEKIQEFEIAGIDGVYYPADAEIDGNKVVLTSDKVTNPINVRYCYSAYPECPNLTDESGMPAYAFVKENKVQNMKSWKFSFGEDEKDGYTKVNTNDEYSSENGYGFLGVSENSCNYTKVVDGYYQTKDSLTSMVNGKDYVKSDNKQYPIRFAVKTEPNTYYKIKVTMSANDADADITLTSERRHFVLTNEKVEAGNTVTKEFTAAVHDVKWKNRDSGKPVPEVYTDDMLNIGVIGENAALNSIEIQQIEKPKTLWIFGDSTVCDAYTAIPYNGFDTAAGWGQAAAKYVNDDIAVVNLAEGGLATSETSYFNVGMNDISAGDIVLMQMGHNENSASKYKANLDYYYNAAKKAGAEFVLCSPIQRLTAGQTAMPWKETDVDTIYAPAAKEYTEGKNTPFIDLNKLTIDKNTELGAVRAWYLHTAYWQESKDEPTAFNDATHMNDYGADVTCRMLMQDLKSISNEFVNDILAPDTMPSDEIMKNGTDSYVMPPYKGNDELFPYPGEADFEYETELSDAVFGENTLKSVKLKRNTQLSYITVMGVSYTDDGRMYDTVTKRLEPSAAGTAEIVELTNDGHSDGLKLSDNGNASVYVWNGAFVDGSISMKPIAAAYKVSMPNFKKMSIAVNSQGSVTPIDTAELYTDENTVGYMVTTSDAEGHLIKQYEAQPENGIINADTDGAVMVEAAPIFKYENITGTSAADGKIIAEDIENGRYSITFKKGTTPRSDVYINGGMIGNNIDQTGYKDAGGSVAKINEAAEITRNDVVISNNSINVKTVDFSGNKTVDSMAYVSFFKEPKLVNRTRKVFVLGDSLVAQYYGNRNSVTGQHGWGEVIENFFTDDVEVVNLANSGQYATGLEETAFSGVEANGEKGDYFIIESGYNDTKHNTAAETTAAVVRMVNAAKAKGMTAVVVSPNCSVMQCDGSDSTGCKDNYSPTVHYTEAMKAAADESGAIYCDLAGETYKYYQKYYGDNRSAIAAAYNFSKDYLHHNKNGAMNCARIVAQTLYDNGADFIDSTFSYTVNDANINQSIVYKVPNVSGETLAQSV